MSIIADFFDNILYRIRCIFYRRQPPSFKVGSVVVHEPANFNPDFWDGLPEEERIRYYGPLGYGAKKQKLFVYMGEILGAPDPDNRNRQWSTGHCVLIDMDTSKLEIMRHTPEFRLATEEEW